MEELYICKRIDKCKSEGRALDTPHCEPHGFLSACQGGHCNGIEGIDCIPCEDLERKRKYECTYMRALII